MWPLVFTSEFGIVIVAIPRWVFECGGGGEYSGTGLLVWFGVLLAGLGLWGPVIMPLLRWVLLGRCGCKSVVLRACIYSLPLVDLWLGRRRFLGLCAFHRRVGFLSISLVALSAAVCSCPCCFFLLVSVYRLTSICGIRGHKVSLN